MKLRQVFHLDKLRLDQAGLYPVNSVEVEDSDFIAGACPGQELLQTPGGEARVSSEAQLPQEQLVPGDPAELGAGPGDGDEVGGG